MSWDLFIGHSNKKTLIKESELKEKLENDFEIIEVLLDKSNFVRSFVLSEKGNLEDWEFTRQEEGYFWASSTASGIEALYKIANNVAYKLDWQVNDPQDNDDWNDASLV